MHDRKQKNSGRVDRFYSVGWDNSEDGLTVVVLEHDGDGTSEVIIEINNDSPASGCKFLNVYDK